METLISTVEMEKESTSMESSDVHEGDVFEVVKLPQWGLVLQGAKILETARQSQKRRKLRNCENQHNRCSHQRYKLQLSLHIHINNRRPQWKQ